MDSSILVEESDDAEPELDLDSLLQDDVMNVSAASYGLEDALIPVGLGIDDIAEGDILKSLDLDEDFEEDADGKRFMVQNGILDRPYTKDDFSLYLARIYYSRNMLQASRASGIMLSEHARYLHLAGGRFENPDFQMDGEDLKANQEQILRLDVEVYKCMLSDAEMTIMQHITKEENVKHVSSSDTLVAQIKNIKLADGLPKDTCEYVIRSVGQRLADTSGDANIDGIYAELLEARPEYAGIYGAYTLETLGYIKAIVTVYSNFMQNAAMTEQTENQYLRNKVQLFLRKDYAFLEEMGGSINDGRLHHVLQIINDMDDYYAICPVCGRNIPIGVLLNVLLFQGDKVQDVNTVLLPSLSRCTCGEAVMLCGLDVFRIKQSLGNALGVSIAKYNEVAATLSSEAPISHFTITAKQLHNTIQSASEVYGAAGRVLPLGIFIECESEQLGHAKPKAGNDETTCDVCTMELCDELEYLEAVRIFYSSLKSTNPRYKAKTAAKKTAVGEVTDYGYARGTARTISYGYVSRFICKSLGLSYVEFKNRALLSLIYLIQENGLLNYIFNGEHKWEIEKEIDLLALFTEYTETTLPKELFADMCISYNKFSKDTATSSEDLYHDKEKVRSMLESLRQRKGVLVKELEALDERYKAAFSSLKEGMRALRFTKILNISAAKFSELAVVINNEEMLDYLNTIADQMIICNFANKFYYKWSLLNDKPSNALKDFDEAIDSGGATHACTKFLMKAGPSFGGTSNSIAYDYFELAGRPSTEPFKRVRGIEIGMKKLNPFLVGSALDDLTSVDSKQFGYVFNGAFKEAVDELHTAFQEYKGDEFETTLKFAGFSQKEIEDYRGSSYLAFERYLPIRKPGETIDEYLQRPAGTECSECIDYLPLFLEHAAALIIVSSVASITTIGYDNFILAAFMIALIDICVNCMRENEANQMLAINSTIGRKLNMNTYDAEIECSTGYTMERVFNNPYCNELDYLTEEYYNSYRNKMLNLSKPIRSSAGIIASEIISSFQEDLEKRLSLNAPIRNAINKKTGTLDVISDVPYDMLIDALQGRLDAL